MSQKTFGLVAGITIRDHTHAASPFEIEVYSPRAPLGSRRQRFHLDDVCDNRDLVFVSTLREALADGLPVMVGSDGAVIHDVEIASRASYVQGEPGSADAVTGTPRIVSVATMGMGDQLHWEGARALVQVTEADAARPPVRLILDLQSPDRDVKLVQFDILRQAQSAKASVHVSYETIGSPAGPQHWIREVALGGGAGIQ